MSSNTAQTDEKDCRLTYPIAEGYMIYLIEWYDEHLKQWMMGYHPTVFCELRLAYRFIFEMEDKDRIDEKRVKRRIRVYHLVETLN